MSYTFRVIFEGVCAWVPDHPFFPKYPEEIVQVNEVDVLLADLSRPEYNSQPVEDLRVFRSPHLALLEFELADLHQATTRRVDLVTRDIGTRDEKGLLHLKREQIRFALDASNETAFRYSDWRPEAFPGPPAPCPTERRQLESLWWLPRLSEIEPDSQQARPNHLSTHYGPLPEELQARIEIKGGFLKTHEFNRAVSGEPIPWRFLPAGSPSGEGRWNRVIGNQQALEFYDVRGPVTLELKRIANDVHTTELVLDLAPGAHRSELEVRISNIEPESLFGLEDRLTAQLPDPDFEEFYYMHSANLGYSGGGHVPNPLGFGLLGIRDKPCCQAEMRR